MSDAEMVLQAEAPPPFPTQEDLNNRFELFRQNVESIQDILNDWDSAHHDPETGKLVKVGETRRLDIDDGRFVITEQVDPKTRQISYTAEGFAIKQGAPGYGSWSRWELNPATTARVAQLDPQTGKFGPALTMKAGDHAQLRLSLFQHYKNAQDRSLIGSIVDPNDRIVGPEQPKGTRVARALGRVGLGPYRVKRPQVPSR